MHLAKPHLDIGLFTERIGSQRAFWSDKAGLRLDHEIKLRTGWVQHRFDAHDSVVKVNHWDGELPTLPPSGYAGLTIAREGSGEWQGHDPDGNRLRLVPPGTDGVVGIGVTVRTPDPERLMAFYLEAMEFEHVAPDVARCGDSLLFLEEGPGGGDADDFIGPGYRYLTVQIFDADKACNDIVARGGRLGRAPISLGDVARFGFVKDPDGNWIEISARTSLIGAPSPSGP